MTTIPLNSTTRPANTEAVISPALMLKTRPPRPSPLSASITFGWRAMLKIRHVPLQLFDVTIFPIMITLMFTFLFGGALAGSVGAYVQTLIPGILVMTVSMISMYTALAINTDITKGIFDRFRSLPFWRPAVLVGALLGDMVRYSIAASVVIGLGLILGFRPEGGIVGLLLGVLMVLVFAFSLSWLWTAMGIVLPTPETVMMVSGMASFPVSFASNIFVDPTTMPGWLQVFVALNPITHAVTATRGLIHGTATPEQIIAALVASAVLLVIFAPLTMYLFRTRNTR